MKKAVPAMEQSSDKVIGHYVEQVQNAGSGTKAWVPALQQSTELFKAVVSDDITRFEAEIDASTGLCLWHTVLYWSDGKEEATPKVEAKSRSLAQIACYHGSLRVLSYLLSKGANPKQAKDGLSCYEFIDGSNPNAPTIRAMLDDAAGNFAVAGEAPGTRSGTPDAAGSSSQGLQGYGQQELDQADLENLPYSTADLTRPEYSTDTFRMYCFKVLRCSKRYAHDWRACPFAHPTENARRRDPREFRYSSLVCPDYRQGCCVRGDTCQYAHGVFESWLHPSRYRTQLCKDQEKCDRPVCFFAHNINELRTPVDSFVPNPDERLRVPEAMQVVLGMASPAAMSASSGGADTAYAADQNPAVVVDLLSPQQRAPSGSSIPGSSCSGAAGSSGGGSQEAAAASSSYSSQADQGAAGGGGSPSPNKQLVSPSTVPVPRMSNAFARKHGLDPKDNPLLNLQRLAMQQQQGVPQPGAAGSSRRQRRSRGPQQSPSPQPPMLTQLPMQGPPPPQLMQPPLSPAAAAAYYGAQSAMPLQPSPQAPPPLLDPQAMALLFGGMNLAGPPLSPAAAAAMAGGGMAGAGMHQHLQMGYGMAGPGAGMGAGMLGQSGLGPPSPLGQPGMHPNTGMHSPQPPPF